MDLFSLNTLRGTKNALLAPKRCDEHPALYIWESPNLSESHCFTASCFYCEFLTAFVYYTETLMLG